jgi:hypothetical protein
VSLSFGIGINDEAEQVFESMAEYLSSNLGKLEIMRVMSRSTMTNPDVFFGALAANQHLRYLQLEGVRFPDDFSEEVALGLIQSNRHLAELHVSRRPIENQVLLHNKDQFFMEVRKALLCKFRGRSVDNNVLREIFSFASCMARTS